MLEKIKKLLQFLFPLYIIFILNIPLVLADTLQVYSDSNDGRIYSSSATWNGARTASSGSVTNTDSTTVFVEGALSSGTYYITRTFLRFDTSSIPDTDTVLSANLCYYTTGENGDNETTYPANASLVSYTSASSTLLATDFDDIGTTKFADDVLQNINKLVGWHCFTLNPAGIEYINKTGFSEFAIRPSNDFDDSTAPSASSNSRMYFSDSTKLQYHPYLLIEYNDSGIPSTLQTYNDLTFINGYSIDSDGKTTNTYFHIPFLAWFVLAVPILWIMGRVVLELIIRMRQS